MPSFNLQETVFISVRKRKNDYTESIFSSTAYFVIKCLKGTVKFFTTDNEFVLTENEMLFIPKSEDYNVKSLGNDITEFCICQCRFIPGVKRHDYIPQKFLPTNEINNLFSNLKVSKSLIDCETYGMFYYTLSKILSILKRNYANTSNKTIYNAITYMEENDRYDIPTLAKLCNISESGFYATFKKVTGLTPIQKKHEIQAQKAEILLKTSVLSIEDICEQIGFNSVKHFRNVMVKRYGKTPFQIRREIKQESN